jgi:trehalose synthase
MPRRPVSRLETVIEPERYARLRAGADTFRHRFAGRTIWNVNSTAVGGGVAEMLQGLVGYVDDLGIAIRWLVIHGDADFFATTKHLHNAVHGHGDPAALTAAAAHHYTHVLTANAVELLDHVRPGDIALLHDPQTPVWPHRSPRPEPPWCGAATSGRTGRPLSRRRPGGSCGRS